jgi:glutamyl-tRNA(Gln) amidotransferase subunit D
MTPETALVKLGWLLGNYKAEEAKNLLNQNMKGEIKSRTLYDEFLI